jgi:hypothetical protein
MEMKPPLLTWLLLIGSLFGCQRQKTTIFVDQAWNRGYAKNACDMYKRSYGTACLKTPDQMATELKVKLASGARQSRTCENVTISYELVGEENMKDYLEGWSLTLNVGIDGREIDYSRSVWTMLDNKTKKRFEGPLRDSVAAATQICSVATSRDSSGRLGSFRVGESGAA